MILGVDPGLTATGYGVLEADGSSLRIMTAGELRPRRTEPLPERLGFIRVGLVKLIKRYRPEIVVLEKIFTHHAHVTTAAMMGHARGAACVAAQECGLMLAEYPSTQVKKSLTGNGHASKDQVARMVSHWLNHHDPGWSSDATDALGLAIVHVHHMSQRRNFLQGAEVGG